MCAHAAKINSAHNYFTFWSYVFTQTFKREYSDISKYLIATNHDIHLEMHTQGNICNLYPPREILMVVLWIQVKFREVGDIFRKSSEKRIKEDIMILCSLKTKCLVFKS